MGGIQFKASLALDVLCFLQNRQLEYEKWMYDEQLNEIKAINSLLPADFDGSCIGMSNICYVLSAFCDDDLELLSLDDLIRIFMSPDQIKSVVKSRLRDGFTASYINPVLDWLKDGFAEKYVKQLSVLKDIGFEKIYQERIMPSVREEMNQKQQEVAGYHSEELFRNIALLKNTAPIKQADIYVSFFSNPIAFTLYGGAFLTCFCSPGKVDFFSTIAHELMHGFASDRLIQLYRIHAESTEKLSTCHRALIEEFHSGDEEELVMAAEYYLCYLSGAYSREQLLQKAGSEYGGNCPTSVSVLELLMREKAIPVDYDKWLISQFENGKIV